MTRTFSDTGNALDTRLTLNAPRRTAVPLLIIPYRTLYAFDAALVIFSV